MESFQKAQDSGIVITQGKVLSNSFFFTVHHFEALPYWSVVILSKTVSSPFPFLHVELGRREMCFLFSESCVSVLCIVFSFCVLCFALVHCVFCSVYCVIVVCIVFSV